MNRFRWFFVVLAVLLAQPAVSDELRPGYLEMRQTSPSAYNLLFKIPARGEDLRLAIYVKLPEGTQDVGLPRASFSDGAYIERRSIRREAGLAGQAISIEGLSATSTDVLVRVETLEGAIQTERLSPTKTSFVLQAVPGPGEVAATYLVLGVEHILFGFDHLLFVLALVILVRDWRRVFLTVTAFTLAHSLTLAAATLGFVSVPGPPIEAAIALSIVLVAVEIINDRRGTPSFAARWPWLVAFCFGLLHGFGFAGALAEVGLPHHAIPIALLFFNLGVEIGQLAFVGAVLAAGLVLHWAAAVRFEPARVQRITSGLDMCATYVIGSIAAYWLIERTSAFFV
ncbi:HupE/UreJ family protein [Bradyrhizobium sp. AUGA SZCCT0182]|uniref:HupE/UreJ family protein n=1 Tax=Bradyrhizobium sp. AUGA SZCCT0182 TaxID=2807667 RepID=UPI001BAB35EE|nr:HupE/UreJ family protein [Bradyrhizobium sp. AUGA SZCCT0182]MBR1237819.1 HupE/UreJ family protein [Bradyrhizobium sp. AUGA SZCCT0182]